MRPVQDLKTHRDKRIFKLLLYDSHRMETAGFGLIRISRNINPFTLHALFILQMLKILSTKINFLLKKDLEPIDTLSDFRFFSR